MTTNRQILIIDDNTDDVELCTRSLAKAQEVVYSLTHVKNSKEAFDYLKSHTPDCILLDYSLPGYDGQAVLSEIRNHHPHLPIIILTGQGNETIATAMMKAGAQDYVVKSDISPERLHGVIDDAILNAKYQKEGYSVPKVPVVLIVDDNPDDREQCIRMLKKIADARYQFMEASSEAAALEKIAEAKPDCILLDYSMPGRNGLEILKQLSDNDPFLSVIMMTGQGNEAVAVQAIKSGAHHYLIKSQLKPDILHNAVRAAIEHSGLERKVYEQEASLAASEAKFRALYLNAPDAYLIMELEGGRITDCNLAAEVMLKGTREQIIGLTPNQLSPELQLNGRSSIEQVQEKIEAVLREGMQRFEWLHQRLNGEIFHCDVNVTLIDYDDRKVLLVGWRDISDRKSIEAGKRMLMEHLTKSNTELERFAYVASHDMQEPIRMVTNFSEIIAKDYGHLLDETGKEYLTLVVNAGKRMKDLVEDLLAYSRVGNESSRTIVFDGENALSGVLENLKNLIAEQQAEITHDALPELYGNPVQFMRLLQNLIINGIKYQAKGNQPKIHIGVDDQGKHWCISVKDNGLGIKQDFIDEIFQPFRRLHTWDNIQGTGLGLSICRKIVENHGGTISVTSKLKEGSVFHFTIPKTASQTAEAA